MNLLLRLAATILLTVTAIAAAAAPPLTAASAFADAPETVFPMLGRNTRLDMIDYFRSGSSTASRNSLDGRSRLTSLEDNRLTVSLTEASDCELSLLPAAGDTLLVLVKTILTPVSDSKITFYSRDWTELPSARYFKAPVLDDWLTEAGRDDRATVESLVPFMLVTYSFDPATGVLTLSNNVASFLNEDLYAMVRESLKPQIQYQWNGKRLTAR